MKNVSSIKTNVKNKSPKTPGGISKSLLTPCRRVGLSRNYKKKGPSPFISPLNSGTPTNVEVKEEKKQTRKRKSLVESDKKTNENVDFDIESSEIPTSCNANIVVTPLRNVELPRRKKSKNFLATLHSQENSIEPKSAASKCIDDCTKENVTSEVVIENDINSVNSSPEDFDQEAKVVSISPEPIQIEQKAKKIKSPLTSIEVASVDSDCNISIIENSKETIEEVDEPMKKKSESKTAKTRSPNELTKECIVVIQKKLLKVKERYNKSEKNTVLDKPKETSQPLFDSDSDDIPLSTLNKKDNIQNDKAVINLDDDDNEFIATSTKNINKVKKIESKKVLNTNKAAAKSQKAPAPKIIQKEPEPPLQSSFDDDDDFFDKKKTILIRKTYDKVVKPAKAKSTGSITQKDIDNLKARIEVKKKMLLGRAMTAESEELRTLIKKWQKGCQEALMELMDLMKIKCPDKHNMDYSEILQMLKIPPSLVGYDSDHDCFNTPDDSDAVLSKFNDF